ncbi:MAG: helicase, partial [Clostridiales bacterium]|nr:helicase [Clostridiales bacterium]
PFRARLHDMDFDDLTVVEKDIPVEFQLGGEGSDLLLNISIEGVIFPITADGEYFYAGGAIHRISEQQQEYLKPFYLAMLSQKGRKLRFIDEDRERFVSEILPFAEKAGTLVISDEVMSIMERVPLEAEIYLDREDRDIAAEVRFIYGDKVINPFLSAVKSETKSEKLLIRDIIREEAILDLLAASDFRVKEGRINLSGEDNIYDFVFTLVPKLQDYAMIYYSDSLRSMTIRTAVSITSRFKLNNESDMLDFSFNIEGIDNEEISGIMASLVHRKKYHRLKNGSMLNLASREFSQLGYFINQMELEKADFNNDYLELPKYRALYLDQLLRDTGLHNVERDHAFKEFVQNVKEPGDTSYSLPPNLNGTLREYQKFGFKWLRTLDTYGLGGILADDMGLGKTIQMMALLLSVKNEAARGNGDADGNGDAGEIGGAGEIAGAGEIGGAGESSATTPQPTSLIVVPTSLVFNWCAELDRFAPDLVYKIVTGNKQERLAIISSASEADILITSYPLIRRDIEAYEDIRFRFCILDEAQHIKNPDSQNSHAVKRINAVRRFAMTGTPMENNLAELWSIFDFVLPGYLHTRAKFTEKYASAAGDEETAEILRELSRQIKPFTLRRLKKDVLDELPEKIEHTMLADITEEQKKVYLAFLSRIKGEIKQEIEEKGFEKSQIKILAALTRLRQICCHPSLFLEDFEGESGKLQLLEEILSDALESDHRILIFSQFTSMLQIIRKRLVEKEVETLYLDGSTPAAERGVLVNSFNDGKGKVFLLSLKAGGSGLNLTGADTVIHFDPWWNPAVEDQATDLASPTELPSALLPALVFSRGEATTKR